MKKHYLLIAAALTMAMSFRASAEIIATDAAADDQTVAPATGILTGPAEMQLRMQQMRQQQMEQMQAQRQARPMMGPRNGMMPPEMVQRMREMHQQRMQMMQADRQARPLMGGVAAPQAEVLAGETAAAESQDPAASGDQDTSCAQRHTMYGKGGGCCRHAKGGMQGNKGMKKQMMEMKRQHMQRMEERLTNIENLMRELVELQKGN